MSDYRCARCDTGTYGVPMGCLCEACEKDIDGMTQAQLDADYAKYSARPKQRKVTAP